jgi:hypothetical protein
MDNMNSQGHANLRKVTPDATVFETSARRPERRRLVRRALGRAPGEHRLSLTGPVPSGHHRHFRRCGGLHLG